MTTTARRSMSWIGATLAAACCALPYVVARSSWPTPWPFAGDPGDYAEDTSATATGFILGSGLLTGEILTLGLILPWADDSRAGSDGWAADRFRAWGYALHRSTEAQSMTVATNRPDSTQHRDEK